MITKGEVVFLPNATNVCGTMILNFKIGDTNCQSIYSLNDNGGYDLISTNIPSCSEDKKVDSIFPTLMDKISQANSFNELGYILKSIGAEMLLSDSERLALIKALDVKMNEFKFYKK